MAAGGLTGGSSALVGETVSSLIPGPGGNLASGAIGGALGGASGGGASVVGGSLGGAIGGALAAALCYGNAECRIELERRNNNCP